MTTDKALTEDDFLGPPTENLGSSIFSFDDDSLNLSANGGGTDETIRFYVYIKEGD